jgi:hypothetical protein
MILQWPQIMVARTGRIQDTKVGNMGKRPSSSAAGDLPIPSTLVALEAWCAVIVIIATNGNMRQVSH